MGRGSGSSNKGSSCLLFVVLVSLSVTFVSPLLMAIPPRPGQYDPETGLSRKTGRPAPSFPEWFGKGIRKAQPVSGEGRRGA